MSNLSNQTISNLEKGQGTSSKTIERLAECLDASPLDFYQEASENYDLKLIRVSTRSSNSSQPLVYIAEINSTNYHIIFALEETLMGNIKQFIFINHDEFDDLLEE